MREAQILRELPRGKTDKETAQDPGVSPKTDDHLLQNLSTKIGAECRAAAALCAMQRGLVGVQGTAIWGGSGASSGT